MPDQTTRRDEIVHHATQLLERGGVAALTIREVARRIGITEPGVYYWAHSKDALVAECLRPLLDEVDGLLSRSNATTLLDLALEYSDIVARHRNLVRVTDQDSLAIANIDGLGDRVEQQNLLVRDLFAQGDEPTQQARAAAVIGAIRRALATGVDLPPTSDEERQRLVRDSLALLDGDAD